MLFFIESIGLYVLILIMFWFSLVSHELFHFVACKIIGVKIKEVLLGEPTISKIKILGFVLKLGDWPTAGHVKFFINKKFNDWKFIFILIAGPLSDFLLYYFAPWLLFKRVMAISLLCGVLSDGIPITKILYKKFLLFCLYILDLSRK